MIKETLKLQLTKIKNLMLLSDPGFFVDVKVELQDWEVIDNKIQSVIISLELESYMDNDLSSVVRIIDKIETKIHSILDKVGFNLDGTLTKPSEDKVIFTGAVMLQELDFSTMEGEKLYITVDCMFMVLD